MSDIQAVEKNADELIAWAAGLFDGDGSSSCYVPRARITPRRQIQVSQAGEPGTTPFVLARFREILGSGNITGPYRGYLFYWKTTRKDEIDRVATVLWPYLSERKKAQFIAMTLAAGRSLPAFPATALRSRETEIAWAAGLFDGEGSVWASGPRTASGRSAGMEIAQSTEAGVPDVLARFASVVDRGTITGPHPPRSPWSRLPQYRWAAHGRHAVGDVVRLLWAHLGDVKRAQVSRAAPWLDAAISIPE